jgi:hypothetical protein
LTAKKNETKVGGRLEDKDVTIKAAIYKSETLFLRVDMASGKDPQGKEYEVCSNINGDSILVRRFHPTPGPWMALGSEALIRAYAQQVEGHD